MAVDFTLKRPCGNCPFLKRRPIPLHSGRVEEIRDALVEGDSLFHCHKTVDYDDLDEEGNGQPTEKTRHCAGALILMRKQGQLWNNWRLRLASVCGFEPTDLEEAEPVFDSWEEMIEAMEDA